MIYYVAGIPYSDELYHHGIKNQKWGVRRYQNPDGSLTALGRVHYGVGDSREEKRKEKMEKKEAKRKERMEQKEERRKVKLEKKEERAEQKEAKRKEKLEKKEEEDKLKHPEKMTTDELKERINRLNLELSYKEAQKKNKGLIKRMVSSAIEKAGNQIVDKAVTELTTRLFDKLNITSDLQSIADNPDDFTNRQISTAAKRVEGLNDIYKYLNKHDANSNSNDDSSNENTQSSSKSKKRDKGNASEGQKDNAKSTQDNNNTKNDENKASSPAEPKTGTSESPSVSSANVKETASKVKKTFEESDYWKRISLLNERTQLEGQLSRSKARSSAGIVPNYWDNISEANNENRLREVNKLLRKLGINT